MSDVNSYYNELLKRAGASPDQNSNATNNIENIGNTIYSQSQLTDNDYEKYLPQAEESVNDDLSSSLISPSEDPSWYGVPGDWLPDWVKQGYNNSIEGLAIHLATGKPHFDIGTAIHVILLEPENFEKNVLVVENRKTKEYKELKDKKTGSQVIVSRSEYDKIIRLREKVFSKTENNKILLSDLGKELPIVLSP